MMSKVWSAAATALVALWMSAGAEAIEYSYSASSDIGPVSWGLIEGAEACGTGLAFESQSPIDIPAAEIAASGTSSPLVPIEIDYPEGAASHTLVNTGGTAQVNVGTGEFGMNVGNVPFIVRGIDSEETVTYNLAQFHFHWGPDASVGSEHTVNGVAYPLEVHLVHFNDAFEFGDAVTQKMGLAVIGVFFEVGRKRKEKKKRFGVWTETDRSITGLKLVRQISEEDNPVLQPIIDLIDSITEPGSSTEIDFDMGSLLQGLDLSNYYSYSGSLTTPPCFETVTWLVLNNTMTVSEAQLEAFRSMLSSEGTPEAPINIDINYRPVQPVNGRPVYGINGATNIPAAPTPQGPSYSYYEETGAGPTMWGVIGFPTCGTGLAFESQSPIDIPAAEITASGTSSPLVPIEIDYPEGAASHTLVNTGGTAQVNVGSGDFGMNVGNVPFVIRGKDNEETVEYSLAQFHFHWGPDASVGSEHTVDGVAYPLEVHLVHFNEVFEFGDAVTQKMGLAVIGVFFEVRRKRKKKKGFEVWTETDRPITGLEFVRQISEEDNPVLQPIIDLIDSITEPGSSTEIDFDMGSLLQGLDLSNYYSYSGSLTTPPCFETVTWLVLNNTMTVSEAQLEAFRSMLSSEGTPEAPINIDINYRPVQPVNGRPVYGANGATNIPAAPAPQGPSYSYDENNGDGPTMWGVIGFHVCGTGMSFESQSPIDIPAAEIDASNIGSPLVPLEIDYLEGVSTHTIKNTGGTVQVDFTSPSFTMTAGSVPFVIRSLGSTDSITYNLAQFHFHWGPDGSVGSEHTVDGQSYPLEVHFVRSPRL